jgi:hypothetical protein
MNRKSVFVLALLLCLGLGLAAVSSSGPRDTADAKQADAAFRDGVYQARMDVASGRKPHFASGRWSTDQDRASYITGYERAYKAFTEARSGKPTELNAVELAAYHDGVLDGARHRQAAQPFQLSRTDNYRKAGGYAAADVNLAAYREAYSNGYQEGYYLPQESAELRTISRN